MNEAPSITARAAVAAYRRDPFLVPSEREEIFLSRLEADPDEKVSAALNQLKRCYLSLVIFYVLKAADLALSSGEIVAVSREKCSTYSGDANTIRRIAASYKGKVPVQLLPPLRDLSEFLDGEAQGAADAPAKLQIVRTSRTGMGPAIRALRHLGRRLRDDFGIEHPPHDPVRWLVEVVLALDSDIDPQVVSDALRKRMGVR
jgi:hypothetical protein